MSSSVISNLPQYKARAEQAQQEAEAAAQKAQQEADELKANAVHAANLQIAKEMYHAVLEQDGATLGDLYDLLSSDEFEPYLQYAKNLRVYGKPGRPAGVANHKPPTKPAHKVARTTVIHQPVEGAKNPALTMTLGRAPKLGKPVAAADQRAGREKEVEAQILEQLRQQGQMYKAQLVELFTGAGNKAYIVESALKNLRDSRTILSTGKPAILEINK
jgi:hypothetical protein